MWYWSRPHGFKYHQNPSTPVVGDMSLSNGAFLYAPYRFLGFPGGWALEISTFLCPTWHSPISSMPFHRAQASLDFQGPTPSSTCPRNGCCPHQKHYARGRINHMCIKSYNWRKLLFFPLEIKLKLTLDPQDYKICVFHEEKTAGVPSQSPWSRPWPLSGWSCPWCSPSP